MSTTTATLLHHKRLPGLAATLGVHLALVWLWQASMQVEAPADSSTVRIQWIDIALPRPVQPVRKITPPPEPVQPLPRPAPRQPRAVKPRAAPSASTPAIIAELPADEVAPAAPPTPTPATPSTYEMMERARKDLGAIDKDLRKEFPGPKIAAPADSPHIRMQRGMEHAAEMAPPRWYEKAKVTELVVPGGNGKRRYRVITARGTFCVTYESNNRMDGIDVFSNKQGRPKYTLCNEHEQAATKQK